MGFRFYQISKNLNTHFFNKYLMQKGYQRKKQMKVQLQSIAASKFYMYNSIQDSNKIQILKKPNT